MLDSLQRPITYLRLSVTELCNLRCVYCMPPEGVVKRRHEDMLTEEETLLAVETALALGITKIRITGGEPLVKRNILSLCRRIAALDGISELCLTTNGVLLDQFAKPLREAGVQRVNISLDTLNGARYETITRIGRLDDALRGLDAALRAGFSQVKINTVLIGGFNDDEIPALAELSRTHGVDVRFIELMPMCGTQTFPHAAYLPADTVLTRLPTLASMPDDGGTARLYRLPDAIGRVGLIGAVSAPFCAQCNRLRLTADGRLKPCLHGIKEFSVKGLDAAGMRGQFLRAVAAKPPMHGALSAEATSEAGRPMHRIGG